MNLGEGFKELARIDLGFADPRIFDHLFVVLRDGNVGERCAVDALDVVRRKEVHIVVALGKFERNIGNNHAQRKGLNADLLVGVFALGVQEFHDVRVMRMQVDRARTLPSAQLVGVGEGILQKLHHGDHPGRLVFDLFNRRTGFPQVTQQQCHPAAALGQLQGGVDGAADGFHIVFDAQQEAGHGLPALRLAAV